MDHHCPWIANCVGFNNQKFFYLFLFYATLGDLIGFICLISKLYEPDFFQQILRPNRRINYLADNLMLEVIYSFKDTIILIIGICSTLIMTLAIGTLFIYQTYLIFNNLTSIESNCLHRKEYSPYYKKDKLRALI